MAAKKKAAKKSAGRTAAKKKAASRRRTGGRDEGAITLLKQDHREVERLFKQFESSRPARKGELAEQICRMLTVHAQIEEEIFYPPARGVRGADDLVDEAQVEHDSAKQLIARIEGMEPDDELFDAAVTVLGEYVRHHVKEEERELFPKLQTRLDLIQLGDQLRRRKAELLGDETPTEAEEMEG